MKRIIFYGILIMTALLAGCRKVDLAPVDDDPVFTANMQMAGAAKEWQAGVGDYYMFSSFEKDPFDVHVFSGSFAKKDSIYGEVFTIRIRDYQQVAQGLPDVGGGLEPGRAFGFADLSANDIAIVERIVWDATFDASESILPASTQGIYDWDFGDLSGAIDSSSSIVHVYDSLQQNMPVTLNLRTSNNDCSGFMTRLVSAGVAQCDLDIELSFNPAIDTYLHLTAIPSGPLPFTYLWSNGLTVDSITIDSLNAGQVSAAVTVTDNAGCTISAGISTVFNPGAVPNICIAKFNYNIVEDTVQDTIVTYADSLQFSKITIEYTNADGVQYRSDRQTQEPNAYIKILDMEDYDDMSILVYQGIRMKNRK